MTREQGLEKLLVACQRLLMKEAHYNVVVPKVLEADFKDIESVVSSLQKGYSPKHNEKKTSVEAGDLS